MATFTGKFQYFNSDGTSLQAGPCRLSFDEEALTLTPESGAPLACDLGDVDLFAPGDYELALSLYTGRRIVLNQFAKAFQDLSRQLLEAYRQRLVRCLLLEDLEEVARYEGFVRLESGESPERNLASPAELRLYKSNLAVLPTQSTGLQWRLAAIDAVKFDSSTWAVTLESEGERLTVTKLGKRTEEFVKRLKEATAELTEKSAATVRSIFPFLTPDQFQQAATLLKEGRAAPVSKLKAINPKTEPALVTNVVDAKLKPYFDALLGHAASPGIYAGFKLLRPDEEEEDSEPQAEEAAAEATSEETPAATSEESRAQEPAAETLKREEPAKEETPILHWFFFPLAARPGAKTPGNLVAWEATSQSGRATYFFRLVPPERARELQDASKAPPLIDAALRQINRAIVLLNFRREPIYLADGSLEMQPRYHRYAIACRKIPELRRLRSSFLGRAIHTSSEAWQKQFESFLSKA